MQSLLRLAFPPQCVACGRMVEEDFGLCGPCWRETPFITGLSCDLCGVPLPGEAGSGVAHCDDCMTIARPWGRGRSALIYKDGARAMVLRLKYGDRVDLVRTLSKWMAGIAPELLSEDTVLVPVPLHPLRLLKRRYNQSALLAKALAEQVARPVIPDLLQRTRRTKVQDGLSVEDRFNNQAGAIQPRQGVQTVLAQRSVLLIDDVMTSGATLAAATEACHSIGARHVDVLTLARVVKDA